MAINLATRDVSAVLACIHDVHAETEANLLPVHLLRTLSRLVPCRLAGFTQVDPVFDESSGFLHPSDLCDATDLFAKFQAHIHEHPVVAHMQRTRDGHAIAISDFLSARQFHATGLYRAVFQPLRLEDQLSISMLGPAGIIIGLSLNRQKRGFSNRDRAVLNLLRPHVIQSFLHARELQLLRNFDGHRRTTVVDQLPIGLACVDVRGSVVWLTDLARKMLREHFAHTSNSIHRLPDAVRIWLRSARLKGEKAGGEARYLPSLRAGLDLTVNWSPLTRGQGIVLFQERQRPGQEITFAGFNLTARECDIMRCMMRGSSAANAAAQLTITPRTVEKHLEHIYRNLGVTSFGSACVKVMGQS